MQLLSISSCAFTLLGSPLIVQMGTAATSVGGKAAIAIGLASFGLFTTGRTSLADVADWRAGLLRLCYSASILV